MRWRVASMLRRGLPCYSIADWVGGEWEEFAGLDRSWVMTPGLQTGRWEATEGARGS